MTAVLLLNAAATWFMCGVIVFVQVVHYPLFDGWDRTRSATLARRHQRLTTWVVAPAMLTELVTSVALVVAAPGWLTGLGVGLVAVWTVSTAAVQVPLHDKLSAGFDSAVHRRLVKGNWLRVAAWLGHGFVCGALLGHAIGS